MIDAFPAPRSTDPNSQYPVHAPVDVGGAAAEDGGHGAGREADKEGEAVSPAGAHREAAVEVRGEGLCEVAAHDDGQADHGGHQQQAAEQGQGQGEGEAAGVGGGVSGRGVVPAAAATDEDVVEPEAGGGGGEGREEVEEEGEDAERVGPRRDVVLPRYHGLVCWCVGGGGGVSVCLSGGPRA